MPEKQNEQELTTPQEVEALRKKTADRSSLIKRYSFSIAFAVVFFVVIAFALGLFGGPGEGVAAKDVAAWYAGKFADVFFVDSALFLGAAGLLFCDRHGAYDTIAYGVREAIGVMFRSPEKRKYKDLYEYKKAKDANRPEFRYLLWIGLVLLVPAIVSLILTYVL